MKFQHVYSDPVRTSDLECKDPSLTQQQFADDADINVMMARFGVTGQMPSSFTLPTYGDFEVAGDFRSAMAVVDDARRAFMTLPGDVRAKFGNDPHNLMTFLDDSANRDEAIRMGFVPASASPPVPQGS